MSFFLVRRESQPRRPYIRDSVWFLSAITSLTDLSNIMLPYFRLIGHLWYVIVVCVYFRVGVFLWACFYFAKWNEEEISIGRRNRVVCFRRRRLYGSPRWYGAFHLPAVLLSKLFSKTCVTRIASIFLRIDKLSTGICQRLSGGLFLPCCKVLRECNLQMGRNNRVDVGNVVPRVGRGE